MWFPAQGGAGRISETRPHQSPVPWWHICSHGSNTKASLPCCKPLLVGQVPWWTLQPPVQPADLLNLRVGWAPPSPACLLFLWVALCLPSFAFLQITTLQASLCQVKGLGISLVAWRAELCSIAHPGAASLNQIASGAYIYSCISVKEVIMAIFHRGLIKVLNTGIKWKISHWFGFSFLVFLIFFFVCVYLFFFRERKRWTQFQHVPAACTWEPERSWSDHLLWPVHMDDGWYRNLGAKKIVERKKLSFT